MTVTQFDANNVLGARLTGMSRQELCEFASALCSRIVSEVGTRGRRGGIYPDNISLDADGNIGIGPAGESPWEGEELKYIAPEQYWNGKIGAAADVYSVGLLLYYATSGGTLPMEGECRDPQLRRMNGDNFKAPKGAGRRLGEIIEKATRFKPEERYGTLEELRVVLDSCVKNLYLSGAPSAEVIFKKSDDELSDVERMMVDIIERDEPEELDEPEPEESAAPAEAGESAAETAAEPEPEEGVRVYEPAAHAKSETKSAESPKAGIPILTEEKNPELEPVVLSSGKAEPQYGKSAEREKKIVEEVRKRRRRPFVVILMLCAVLVVAAIVFNAILRDYQEAKVMPDSGSGLNIEAPESTAEAEASATPAPTNADNNVAFVNGGTASTAEPAASPTPEVVEHRYELYLEDLSWTEAKAKCEELGGHLVTIGTAEEFNTVVDLMIENNVSRAWIGCHRVDGVIVWEDGEQGYMQWTRGEPSYVDTNDEVAEDYVMLWNNNGWGYNDNRNDPIADYPELYSGKLAYICEYGE